MEIKRLRWGRFFADEYQPWIFFGAFVYAFILGQGIPLWDDDFTSWFWKIKGQSLFHYMIEWLSPISTQPQFWGFNERPLQALIYKVCYLISGYESWSYFLYKDLIFGGLMAMIYAWSLRLVSKDSRGRMAALMAALFFLVLPGPTAAHVIQSDLATTAEFLFLVLTYWIVREVERTPESWTGTPKLDHRDQRNWLIRWSVLAFVTYLGYKSKADLKLIPAILFVYILAIPSRRKQLGFFAIPIGLMVLLAIPWGPGVFSKLPPFLPGSRGSEMGWMWQPASLEHFRDFLWSSDSYEFVKSLSTSTISLAGMLGPFLLVALIVFLAWRMEAFDKVPWTRQHSFVDRSRTFALIWFTAMLTGASALPPINYIFRIRYGILPMVPFCLLLAWVFSLFIESIPKLPKWATVCGVLLFVFQSGINLNRSLVYRREMGQVMVSVDQVYDYVDHKIPSQKLTLFPDFRPYDYRPDASSIFAGKTWLENAEDLEKKKFDPFKTYVISWRPSLWEELELVEHFSGCRDTSVFDHLFPCPVGTGTFLMRYIGHDSLYAEGELRRNKGDIDGARKQHEEFLSKYPGSLAGNFVIGLEAISQKDWKRADQAYSILEKFMPDHMAILYNHALVLSEMKRYDSAEDRLKYVLAKEPSNYAALINLYWIYMRDGKSRRAKDTLFSMKRTFPNDGEVNRLLASQGG